MIFNETCTFLTKLTILFLLGQNRHFFTLGEVQEEKHRLLSDDVREIYIIYLQCGDTRVINSSFVQGEFHSRRYCQQQKL